MQSCQGGWPRGQLLDVLAQQPGIGEVRLLQAALTQADTRPIMLIQPSFFLPSGQRLGGTGGDPSRLVWGRAAKAADALWCAEQAARSVSFAAILLWHDAVRGATLRRLQLAAPHSDSLFALFRPLIAAEQASAAPLRPKTKAVHSTPFARRLVVGSAKVLRVPVNHRQVGIIGWSVGKETRSFIQQIAMQASGFAWASYFARPYVQAAWLFTMEL